MAHRSIPLGMIFLDSPRARAYLHAMNEQSVFPQEVVLMAGGGLPEGLVEEAARYGYNQQYFDLQASPSGFFREQGVTVHEVPSADINSPEVRRALKRCGCKDFLFTGGGIIAGESFRVGKRFIHIHPGFVPEFRGSTCFYYSLLEEGELGATAFFMVEELDKGPVLARKCFRPNVHLELEQRLFIDHVLDPYIRMETFREVLEGYVNGTDLEASTQPPGNRPAYYVAHPLLRRAAFDVLNGLWNPDESQGIFAMNR